MEIEHDDYYEVFDYHRKLRDNNSPSGQEENESSEKDSVFYAVNIKTSFEEKSLSLIVPEEHEGHPISYVRISYYDDDYKAIGTEKNAPKLEYLYLPKSVRQILVMDFKIKSGTTEEILNPMNECKVEIGPENPYLCAYNNGIYTKDMTTLIYVFSPGECFEIPEGVTTLKSRAGFSLKGLKRLVISESVSYLRGAFFGCNELEEVDIRAKKLEDHAFFGFDSIRFARLSCKKIGNYAFSNCRALENVEFVNTMEIGKRAFSGCERLAEIHLPDTLIKIGNYAFSRTKIAKLTIPRSVRHIGTDILKDSAARTPIHYMRTAEEQLVRNYLRYSDSYAITLEVDLKDGVIPVVPGNRPAEDGTLLVVRSHETDEKLFEFVVLGSIENVFTEHGVDFTEYDKLFYEKNTSGTLFFGAQVRLRCPYKATEEAIVNIKRFASVVAAEFVHIAIDLKDGFDQCIVNFPYFDLIDDENMRYLVKHSAKTDKVEQTAFLLQKKNERKSHE